MVMESVLPDEEELQGESSPLERLVDSVSGTLESTFKPLVEGTQNLGNLIRKPGERKRFGQRVDEAWENYNQRKDAEQTEQRWSKDRWLNNYAALQGRHYSALDDSDLQGIVKKKTDPYDGGVSSTNEPDKDPGRVSKNTARKVLRACTIGTATAGAFASGGIPLAVLTGVAAVSIGYLVQKYFAPLVHKVSDRVGHEEYAGAILGLGASVMQGVQGDIPGVVLNMGFSLAAAYQGNLKVKGETEKSKKWGKAADALALAASAYNLLSGIQSYQSISAESVDVVLEEQPVIVETSLEDEIVDPAPVDDAVVPEEQDVTIPPERDSVTPEDIPKIPPMIPEEATEIPATYGTSFNRGPWNNDMRWDMQNDSIMVTAMHELRELDLSNHYAIAQTASGKNVFIPLVDGSAVLPNNDYAWIGIGTFELNAEGNPILDFYASERVD